MVLPHSPAPEGRVGISLLSVKVASPQPTLMSCTHQASRREVTLPLGHSVLFSQKSTVWSLVPLVKELQTATSALEAQPEGESVTMLPPMSDHSVKVFIPTLSVSHQRRTLFRQKTADNMEADNTIATDLPANSSPANELPTTGTALHNGLTAQHNLVEEESGWVQIWPIP
jgi:hypothetical protein